nr:hypothetical protein [Planococcus glaciei]
MARTPQIYRDHFAFGRSGFLVDLSKESAMSINSMAERGETGFPEAKVKYAQRWRKYAQQTIKYAQQVKKYAQQRLKYDFSRTYIEENGAAQIPWALRFLWP